MLILKSLIELIVELLIELLIKKYRNIINNDKIFTKSKYNLEFMLTFISLHEYS